MKLEIITKDNINHINYNDVIIIFFSESGAMGDTGRADIITFKENKYKWYTTNYTFIGVTEPIRNLCDITREEEKLFNILPILKDLNFNHTLLRETRWVNDDWCLFDLSFGNHLLIKDKNLTQKIMKQFSKYESKDLYKVWQKIIEKELKCI